mmetsp:Transcript_33921/g.62421  ORF Transcript_33921/g.62421 Transcript_33921/m.62421 type:complete len:150 (+) Transcript_33921:300-749(+)
MTAENMTLFCRLGALAHEPLPPRELLLAAPRLCCSFPVASLGISFWFYLCSSDETGEIAKLLFVHVHFMFTASLLLVLPSIYCHILHTLLCLMSCYTTVSTPSLSTPVHNVLLQYYLLMSCLLFISIVIVSHIHMYIIYILLLFMQAKK